LRQSDTVTPKLRAILEAMKTDLSDEEVKLIVEALEHYYAYTRATRR
jgi:hypothetical protein